LTYIPKLFVSRPAWPTSTSRPVVTLLQPSVAHSSPDHNALNAQYSECFSFTYAREGHSNTSELEQKVDSLEGIIGVTIVLHPSSPDHPNHNRAVQVFGNHLGNMMPFEVSSGLKAANTLTNAASDLSFAPTLSVVGTTPSHQASSSQRALTKEGRSALGISESIFRVLVGLEDAELLASELTVAIVVSQKA
jgi:cystathionine beta-lyase/cystathionine gamma-synthase